ncbi:MAG TPA: 3-deoxy-D-manno-octulosonic acid transferase [Dissulfurispiraceae bacterium]|nr:3-deoxy-D-manno-octulosonic acid transferase [Dissulfurispiraceae bacterium]
MLYWLYSAFYAAALVFLLPIEYLKRPAEFRKRWLRERCGLYAETQFICRPIWIHAVSVGEVIASVPLIKKIKQRHPSLEIVISTVTDTGQKVALEQAGAYAGIIYVPFDLPFAIKKALQHIRPSAFIIMETELWPHIIRILKESDVPVVLLNGRLSERSYQGYRKLGFFIRTVLRNISLLCVQDDVYAARFMDLGAPPERIKVVGSFKFDTRPSSDVPEWTEALCGPVIIAGSTHETEEELVLDAYKRLKTYLPSLNLVIAPRHPGRFKTVEELAKKMGLEYFKRSELKVGFPDSTCPASGIVVILDVMGELSAVYGAADIAVMGGSFIQHGGQNPLEPAFWGKAVVCGPHMENFPFIGEFYSHGGAVKAEGPRLYNVLKDLLDSPERMRRMGSTAKKLYEKNAGAVERAMELIEEYLKTS